MKTGQRFRLSLATLVFLALPLTAVWAQDGLQPADISYPSSAPVQSHTDPPGRVARIQYMTGEVSIQPGGVNDWVAAEMNRPLTTSDRVWTDKNSKAELNVGGGYVRLNAETSLTLSNVSDNAIQLELDQGTVSLTVRNLRPGEVYEVDTPNAAFTVMKPGLYRFDVYPNEDQTWATTRQGLMEATGRGNAVKIKSGEQVRFKDTTSLAHNVEPAPAPDGFDDWATVRNERLESSQAARYVSPGVVGYQDLDAYGNWSVIPPYGPVWIPNSVPVGWAPYRFGHWVWIAPWGWTWVDDAPWGFAPFHYGRWVYTGGYWGWAPGPYRYWTPYYAPALVAWVGGPGWSFGFGFGGVGWGVSFGWFPLGWGEPFYPCYHGWYGHGLSATYIRNVNITNTYIANVTNITNNYHNAIMNTHYVNRSVNGAVTAAPQAALVSGQPINRFGSALPPAQAEHAPLVRTINPMPTRQSVLGGRQPLTTGVPSRALAPLQIVTRATPPPRPATLASLSSAQRGGTKNNPAGSLGTPPAANPRNSVPRPLVAGGAPLARNAEPVAPVSREVQPVAPAQNVPRPPANDRETQAPDSAMATPTRKVPRPPHTTSSQSGSASNAVQPPNPPRAVSVPGSITEVQHAPSALAPRPESAPIMHQGTSPSPHEPAPAMHQTAPPAIHPTQPSRPRSEGPNAYSVPRPPAGYTYHPAPAPAASNYAAASYVHGNELIGTGNTSYAGGIYSSHASYSSPAPAYHVGGYSPVPGSAAAVATSAMPHYAAPVTHYSGLAAPHYSAGTSAVGHSGTGGGHSGRSGR